MVREDAQKVTFIPDPFNKFDRNITRTHNGNNFNREFDDPAKNNNFDEHKDFSKLWSIVDEPAPQWLIDEALSRREKNDENNQSTKEDVSRNNIKEDSIRSSFNADNIINDLEKQLSMTRAELADALNEQSIIKNKYKNALKNFKISANEERDKLQHKLVEMCTLIFEKFGQNASNNKTIHSSNKKRQRPLRHFGKLSKKIYKKLRIATLTSSRLKQEIVHMKEKFEGKIRDYESMLKCFSSLKIELQNTKSSMNDLMNENLSLRKKIADTREWMHTKVNKERHEKINAAQFREIQRSRELINLKKKSEEDISTIAQLRGKLFRSESANANKGFLLNSYKSQVADLRKEKESLTGKLKELEADNNSLRNANAQIKANLTLINRENEKLTMDSEKSEMDVKDRMQSELALKYEKSVLHKIDILKAENDKTIEAIRTKLNNSEHTISEYRNAIKRFLKEVYEFNRELDVERDWSCSEASEREAHETACEILNITPGELTGFLKGRSTNTINSWLFEMEKIEGKKYFAKDLGKFLFKRAITTRTTNF